MRRSTRVGSTSCSMPCAFMPTRTTRRNDASATSRRTAIACAARSSAPPGLRVSSGVVEAGCKVVERGVFRTHRD